MFEQVLCEVDFSCQLGDGLHGSSAACTCLCVRVLYLISTCSGVWEDPASYSGVGIKRGHVCREPCTYASSQTYRGTHILHATCHAQIMLSMLREPHAR